MSDKDIAKKAFAEIEEEKVNKQVAQVKEIVTKTLEKLDAIKKQIKELQDQEKVLKMDIDDLKEGRLDRISERQEKDPEAKNVSVVVILKEKEVVREVSPWYWPYRVTWQYAPPIPITYVGTLAGSPATQGLTIGSTSTTTLSCGDTINCSVAKNATIGTYSIDGRVFHLR